MIITNNIQLKSRTGNVLYMISHVNGTLNLFLNCHYTKKNKGCFKQIWSGGHNHRIKVAHAEDKVNKLTKINCFTQKMFFNRQWCFQWSWIGSRRTVLLTLQKKILSWEYCYSKKKRIHFCVNFALCF